MDKGPDEELDEDYETYKQDKILYKYLLVLAAILVAVIVFYHYTIAEKFSRRPLGKKTAFDIRCDESADGYDPDTGLVRDGSGSTNQSPRRKESTGLDIDSPRKKESSGEPKPFGR